MIAKIEGNLKQFNDQLKEDIKKEVNNKSKLVLKKARELFFDICKETPVLTGNARKNWYMKVDGYDDRVIPKDEADRSLSESQAKSKAEIFNIKNADIQFNISKNNSIWIYNNVEYISELENGYSTKKAPAGMVAISLAKHFKDISYAG